MIKVVWHPIRVATSPFDGVFIMWLCHVSSFFLAGYTCFHHRSMFFKSAHFHTKPVHLLNSPFSLIVSTHLLSHTPLPSLIRLLRFVILCFPIIISSLCLLFGVCISFIIFVFLIWNRKVLSLFLRICCRGVSYLDETLLYAGFVVLLILCFPVSFSSFFCLFFQPQFHFFLFIF